MNVLLVEQWDQLTSNVPVTVKTSKIPAAKQGRAYSHKIDGLSFDGGDKPSRNMSSDSSCLRGRMSLFPSER